MIKTTIAAISLSVLASASLADQPLNSFTGNIGITAGAFDTAISSLSQAGVQIQGTQAGTISGDAFATNLATGTGAVQFGADFGQNEFEITGSSDFATNVQGSTEVNAIGIGDIVTLAGSFGSSSMSFEGTFDVNIAANDFIFGNNGNAFGNQENDD